MTAGEVRFGFAYLLLQQFVLPLLLPLINGYLPSPLSAGMLNFVYFSLNFVCILAIFHGFLRKSLAAIRLVPFFRAVGYGFLLYYAASMVVTALILRIDPSFSNINDAGISGLLREKFAMIAVGTVLLVPTVEETLFRGLIFGNLLKKNRKLAYLVSVAAFSAIHVAGYIGSASPLTLALCFLQYIPAGVWLARAYVTADTIFAPILIHTIVNAIGILAMR